MTDDARSVPGPSLSTTGAPRSRSNLLAHGCLVVELKAAREVLPIHKAQLFNYMTRLDVPVGLIFNFHEVKLTDGISRLVLHGASVPQKGQ